MNWKKIAVSAAAFFTLAACSNGDDNAVGQRDTTNIEPVRNEGSLQSPMRYDYGQVDRYGNNSYDGTYPRGRNLTTEEINYENRQKRDENNQKYEVSEKAGKQITEKIDQIDQAYVLKMGNNAYVAAELDQGNNTKSKATETIKKEIAKIVKKQEKDVDYVHVSTNPDFVDLTTNYADQIRNGEPIEGFFDQMGNMIQRVFPNGQR